MLQPQSQCQGASRPLNGLMVSQRHRYSYSCHHLRTNCPATCWTIFYTSMLRSCSAIPCLPCGMLPIRKGSALLSRRRKILPPSDRRRCRLNAFSTQSMAHYIAFEAIPRPPTYFDATTQPNDDEAEADMCLRIRIAPDTMTTLRNRGAGARRRDDALGSGAAAHRYDDPTQQGGHAP